MTEISSLLSRVFYTVDATGQFRYTEAGISAYKPLLARLGKEPEDIRTLDDHRAALDRLKSSAADALEQGVQRRGRKS